MNAIFVSKYVKLNYILRGTLSYHLLTFIYFYLYSILFIIIASYRRILIGVS
jgi:hypothetical protein